MSDLVRVSNLKFSYPGHSRPVLDIPEFSLKSKERVFLLGPSGSGKSTFLEILAGVLTGEGDVQVMGQSLGSLAPHDRDRFRGSHLGYIFQNFNLIPYLSIRDNIELPIRLNPERRARLKKGLGAEIAFLAGKLGIENLLDRKVGELSVGQQQRVAAARALIGAPSLILADEPTSALDHDHRRRFIELLFEVCEAEGAGVLFVSHDRSLRELFDRQVELAELNRVKA